MAENQPEKTKTAMTSELSDLAALLRARLFAEEGSPGGYPLRDERDFNALALRLFALQFGFNAPYRRLCEARGIRPESIASWKDIPAMPTGAFKELELSCLQPSERVTVFHSSGTTGHRPSRHFHSRESLRVYEASLWPWFRAHVLPGFQRSGRFAFLAPPPAQAPHSSLVHMFATIRSRACESADSAPVPGAGPFLGQASDEGWTLDFAGALEFLDVVSESGRPAALLGTAFSFVHLCDFLEAKQLRFTLPPGSRVMETGGYKGRSRSLPGAELRAFIADRLGISAGRILCEYGMSELSSQAYDRAVPEESSADAPVRETSFALAGGRGCPRSLPASVAIHQRRGDSAGVFRFPPWARSQVISPETGGEVEDGETGLLRIVDLANVFSVLAVQTEDLAVRRGDGFELLGRSEAAEPRGCSLTAAAIH